MGRLCKSQTLTLMTNIGACCSFCFLFVSVITNYWLYTMEKHTNANGTIVQVHIYSGLWKKCVQDPRSFISVNCSYISYFTHVDKDGLGSTESILLSLRRAVAFPLLGLLLQLIAQTICFLSHCSLQRQAMTIVSGVLYVAGGLLTLVGIIIYIGAITEEAGNKIKASEDPKFTYNYGPSLLMAIGSFVGSQLTGVMSVNLYISRKEADYIKNQQLAAIEAGDGGTTGSNGPSSTRGGGTNHSRAPPSSHHPRGLTATSSAGALGCGGGGGGGGGATPEDEASSWRGYSIDSPSRSDTFCTTHTTSKDLSSYSLLSRDLAAQTTAADSANRVPIGGSTALGGAEDDRRGGGCRQEAPPSLGRPPGDVRSTLSREWSEGSATTRTDLSRQWSERSVDARSSLSRDWSKCSTEEGDVESAAYRRITPV